MSYVRTLFNTKKTCEQKCSSELSAIIGLEVTYRHVYTYLIYTYTHKYSYIYEHILLGLYNVIYVSSGLTIWRWRANGVLFPGEDDLCLLLSARLSCLEFLCRFEASRLQPCCSPCSAHG